MGLTPTDLRNAADVLRRSASFVTTAFEPVGPRSDGETWQGPAANVFRGGFHQAEGRVLQVSAGLFAAAIRLEARADQLQAEIEEAERQRAEALACWRWEVEAIDRRRRGSLLRRPPSCSSPPIDIRSAGDGRSLDLDLGLLERDAVPGS